MGKTQKKLSCHFFYWSKFLVESCSQAEKNLKTHIIVKNQNRIKMFSPFVHCTLIFSSVDPGIPKLNSNQMFVSLYIKIISTGSNGTIGHLVRFDYWQFLSSKRPDKCDYNN